MTYANGEKIQGTWENDRLNGIAKVRKPGKDWIEVIYKDDMLIMENSKGMTCCEWTHTFFAIIFMFAFYGMIPLGLLTDPYLIFIMFGVLFVYAIHACCQESSSYIFNLLTLEEAFASIELAIEAPPEVTISIQNYHYRTVRTKNGTRRRRVNTHYAAEQFVVGQW